LFEDLLEIAGDRKRAIILKSNAYSNNFIKRFGDWTEDKGEPLTENVEKFLGFQKTPHIQFTSLQKVNPNAVFGDDLSSALESGQTVSSKDLVSSMLTLNQFGNNSKLAEILSKHDIPVMYGETDLDILAVTVTDKNGGSYIVINKEALGNVSSGYLATAILHEVVHAITVDAINNPVTEEQKALASANKNAFELLNKVFNRSIYSRSNFDQGFYALSNEKEFAAIFMTDENVR
jgi:hypothetical protein